MNQLRLKAGKTELQIDPAFTSLAMEHAKAACDGKPLTNDALSARAGVLGYGGGMVMAYTVTHLLASDLSRDTGLIETPGTHLAVGVCQGAFEGQPRGERVVFLVSSKVAPAPAPAPARKR